MDSSTKSTCSWDRRAASTFRGGPFNLNSSAAGTVLQEATSVTIATKINLAQSKTIGWADWKRRQLLALHLTLSIFYLFSPANLYALNPEIVGYFTWKKRLHGVSYYENNGVRGIICLPVNELNSWEAVLKLMVDNPRGYNFFLTAHGKDPNLVTELYNRGFFEEGRPGQRAVVNSCTVGRGESNAERLRAFGYTTLGAEDQKLVANPIVLNSAGKPWPSFQTCDLDKKNDPGSWTKSGLKFYEYDPDLRGLYFMGKLDCKRKSHSMEPVMPVLNNCTGECMKGFTVPVVAKVGHGTLNTKAAVGAIRASRMPQSMGIDYVTNVDGASDVYYAAKDFKNACGSWRTAWQNAKDSCSSAYRSTRDSIPAVVAATSAACRTVGTNALGYCKGAAGSLWRAGGALCSAPVQVGGGFFFGPGCSSLGKGSDMIPQRGMGADSGAWIGADGGGGFGW